MAGKHTNQDSKHYTLEEVNTLVGKSYDLPFWLFLIQRIDYNEILFDPEDQSIVCPSYIPFKDLAKEIINDLDFSSIQRCQICSQVFDINQAEGIFGDPTNLKRFICTPCSETLSAKVFYDSYLVT